MIKRVTTITIEEYLDSTNTPKVVSFEDSFRYRIWDDSLDVYLSTESDPGEYGYSKHIEDLNAYVHYDTDNNRTRAWLYKFTKINKEQFKQLKKKIPEYPYWSDLQKYQLDLINFRNSFSYDEQLDTLNIKFSNISMIGSKFDFNNIVKVLEYYEYTDINKTKKALVIPGFKYRDKTFIKALSIIYPDYPYWNLIEQML